MEEVGKGHCLQAVNSEVRSPRQPSCYLTGSLWIVSRRHPLGLREMIILENTTFLIMRLESS